MPSLSNPYLHFSFDLNTGCWSLHPRAQETPYLEEVRLGAAYKVRSKSVLWDGALDDMRADAPVLVDSVHGCLTVLTIRGRARSYEKAPGGLRWDFEFALPEDRPFLLWRVTAHNAGERPLALEAIDLAVVGPQPARKPAPVWPLQLLFGWGGAGASIGALRLPPSPGRLAFFSNGDQSWSFAGGLPAGRRQPSSHFGPFRGPKRVNLRTPNVRGRGTSSVICLGPSERARPIGRICNVSRWMTQTRWPNMLRPSRARTMRLRLRLWASAHGHFCAGCLTDVSRRGTNLSEPGRALLRLGDNGASPHWGANN
jgi:hypothetical protein